MKYFYLLLFTFVQLDLAYAENDTVAPSVSEKNLEVIKDLHVFSLRIPPQVSQFDILPHITSSQSDEADSCQLRFENRRSKQELDYSCDGLKTFKIETLNIASN